MQRKNFPLGEGGWGEEGSDEGSDEGSEEKSCENFLSILTFSREKSVLTKVVLNDTRSIKKYIVNYLNISYKITNDLVKKYKLFPGCC